MLRVWVPIFTVSTSLQKIAPLTQWLDTGSPSDETVKIIGRES